MFFTYYRKRNETVQEYTSEFNRRYPRAHKEKIDLGNRVRATGTCGRAVSLRSRSDGF